MSRRVSVGLSVELVDDMTSLTWELLATQTHSVLGAEQPWAYLMSAAAQALTNEARAQRYLTGSSTIRGAGRVHVPQHVNPIGAAAAEVETELYGHAAAMCPESPRPAAAGTKRARWLDAFVDLLAEHGADPAVTGAAVDRISELAETTSAWRETVVRRDQVLDRMGIEDALAAQVVGPLPLAKPLTGRVRGGGSTLLFSGVLGLATQSARTRVPGSILTLNAVVVDTWHGLENASPCWAPATPIPDGHTHRLVAMRGHLRVHGATSPRVPPTGR